MFGRRTPTQSTDTTGRVSPRASPRGSYTGTGAFDRAQPSPPASPRYSSAGGVGTGVGTGTTGTGTTSGQQYGQSTTGSSPRYAQQTTTTGTGYTGTGTGIGGTSGTGKLLTSSTEGGRAEFPGIGGSLAPLQHTERFPLAAAERQYGGVVCNRQYFTVTEDRTVLRYESLLSWCWIRLIRNSQLLQSVTPETWTENSPLFQLSTYLERSVTLRL